MLSVWLLETWIIHCEYCAWKKISLNVYLRCWVHIPVTSLLLRFKVPSASCSISFGSVDITMFNNRKSYGYWNKPHRYLFIYIFKSLFNWIFADLKESGRKHRSFEVIIININLNPLTIFIKLKKSSST
jgi:hypothetical protein